MAIGKDGKEIVVGTEDFIWDDEDKIADFIERRKEAKKEVRALPSGGKFITFLTKKGYNTPYSLNTKILYKQSVSKFKANGLPVYKPHMLTIKQGRIKTSLSEEIAFLDMSKDYIREADRPLTPIELERKKTRELELKIAIMESKEAHKDEKWAKAAEKVDNADPAESDKVIEKLKEIPELEPIKVKGK